MDFHVIRNAAPGRDTKLSERFSLVANGPISNTFSVVWAITGGLKTIDTCALKNDAFYKRYS